jgi:hypothetical protein
MQSVEAKNRPPTPPKLPVIISHLCAPYALWVVWLVQLNGYKRTYKWIFAAILGYFYGYLDLK